MVGRSMTQVAAIAAAGMLMAARFVDDAMLIAWSVLDGRFRLREDEMKCT
jgi:hypothetical protein